MLPVKILKIGIQRKGKYSGSPSIYVGVGGCNLRCEKDGKSCNGEECTREEKNPTYTEEDVLERLEECRGWIKHVVFSGGEPLLYKKEMEELVGRIVNDFEDIKITIETNGTLPPLNPLKGYKSNIYYIVSPKKEECFNEKTVMNIIISCGDYDLCFPFIDKNIGGWVREVEKKLEEKATEMGLFIHEFYLNNHPMDHIILMTTKMKEEKYMMKNEKRVDEMMDGLSGCKLMCVMEGWKYGEEFEDVGNVEGVKKLREMLIN